MARSVASRHAWEPLLRTFRSRRIGTSAHNRRRTPGTKAPPGGRSRRRSPTARLAHADLQHPCPGVWPTALWHGGLRGDLAVAPAAAVCDALRLLDKSSLG